VLPDVYLIGAPKAGTTSLARWLSTHPDVYVSVPKEPFYWASDYPKLREHYGFANLAAYEALFANAAAAQARHRVEGSTIYIYSETAVPDIEAALDSARFVLTLRNPVDLLVSYHRTQLVALNESEPDFATAWHRSLAGQLPGTDPLDSKLLDYPRIGAIGAAVSRLLSVVPRGRVHVIDFDSLRTDPGRVWSQLTSFLDIDENPVPSFTAYNVSAKMYRFPRVRRLTHRPPDALAVPIRRLRQWSRTTRMPAVAKVKKKMWRPESKPKISPGTRAEVAEYFSSDVELLAELVETDPSGWENGR